MCKKKKQQHLQNLARRPLVMICLRAKAFFRRLKLHWIAMQLGHDIARNVNNEWNRLLLHIAIYLRKNTEIFPLIVRQSIYCMPASVCVPVVPLAVCHS